ncbi:hypothetical protein Rhopal_006360-T1 [Rhodotorula paludigena]|uniref:Phenazine biosynthesis PhzC/PhzF protein n=1 Tax=Rhodotorula paludigena TaxID=86838 RepID=A0AAV5GSU4_9BASI|nr:hypothetical protein Rhopal_006360-T1 [Rhodotorula paludigena]
MASSLPFETVDAFTAEPFAGNPAAVLVFPLASPPALQQLSRDDALMQKIAAEFNLSETAFCVELEGGSDEEPSYELRWRTPTEAHTLFTSHHPAAKAISFHTRKSGVLRAIRNPPSPDDTTTALRISLDFPSASLVTLSDGHRRLPKIFAALKDATGLSEADVRRIAWYDAWEAPVIELSHTSTPLAALDVRVTALASYARLWILTQPSPEEGYDIHSRVFGPAVGIDEDPVTGAAHCALVPFWLLDHESAARLPGGGSESRSAMALRAKQVGKRGGEMVVVLDEEKRRVELRGQARRVMKGVIEL